MPEPLIVCPSCGHEVPRGKYCNLCGKTLPQSSTETVIESEESPTEPVHDSVGSEEESVSAESVSLPHFDVIIDNMPYEASAILLSGAELKVLDEELDRIIEQTKATRQALQLRQADRAVLTARAERLREEFERAKERRRELVSVNERLLLETLLEALDRHEARLSKLEAISGTLDKDVYGEQRVEILQTIKDVRTRMKEAVKTGNKWSKGIKSTLKRLDKERSRLDAKFKIGDISREKYESSKSKLERSIRVVEGGGRKLDELLALTKKR